MTIGVSPALRPPRRAVVEDFDNLPAIHPGRIALRRGSVDDLPGAFTFARQYVTDDLAPLDVVNNVISHNPNNLLLMRRNGNLAGFWAMLMLNARGIEALLAGDFDARHPRTSHLSTSAEAPTAIYVWVIACPGTAAEGIHHVSQFLRQPLYRFANLYSRPTTEAGVKINLRRGFSPLQSGPIGLFRYVRDANRAGFPISV